MNKTEEVIEMVFCEWCGDEVSPDEINSDGLCGECEDETFICPNCHYRENKDEAEYVESVYVCQRCYNNAFYCEYHDEMFFSCRECGDCDGESDPHFGYANYALFTPAKHATCPQTYLGWELEVEFDGSYSMACAQEIIGETHKHGEIEGRSDGSLSEDGMEIVTNPRTLKHHYDTAKIVCDAVKGCDFDGCGLHIHFSNPLLAIPRNAIKLYTIFYTLEKAEVMKRLCGRAGNSYVQILHKRLDRYKLENAFAYKDMDEMVYRNDLTDHYCALSACDWRRGHFEFRRPKGTSSHLQIIAMLQLVDIAVFAACYHSFTYLLRNNIIEILFNLCERNNSHKTIAAMLEYEYCYAPEITAMTNSTTKVGE